MAAWKAVRLFPKRKSFQFRTCCLPADILRDDLSNHIMITQSKDFPDDVIAQKPLEARTMADSKMKFVIPLSTDEQKRLEYLTAYDSVRLGKLFQDLDSIAVWVGFSHNRDKSEEIVGSTPTISVPGTLPRMLVTASLYRMDIFKHRINPTRDIFLEGGVTWAGNSSLEASMNVFQRSDEGSVEQIMRASFIMASRHPSKNAAVRVHPLKAETMEDASIIRNAEESAIERKRAVANSLVRTYPTIDEFHLLHNNLLEAVLKTNGHVYDSVLRENQIWLHHTECENHIYCFPENQNIYGKIFGGFLMKQAMELAYLNSRIFAGERVCVIAVDDVTFKHPVNIGDILKLNCVITHTKDKYIQTHVRAEVIDSTTFTKKVSNEFRYTMETISGKEVRQVVPKHYNHGTLWLEGHRHLNTALRRLNRL